MPLNLAAPKTDPVRDSQGFAKAVDPYANVVASCLDPVSCYGSGSVRLQWRAGATWAEHKNGFLRFAFMHRRITFVDTTFASRLLMRPGGCFV